MIVSSFIRRLTERNPLQKASRITPGCTYTKGDVCCEKSLFAPHCVSLYACVCDAREGKIPAAHKASKPTICLSWTHKCYLYIQRKHHSLIISSSIRNLPLISSAESLSLLPISAQRLSHLLICLPQVYAHKVSHWKLIWTAWISLSMMPLQMVYSSMWLNK